MKSTLLLITCTIILYSCKDKDVITLPNQASTQASQDHLLAENIFNDISIEIEKGFLNNDLIKNKIGPTYIIQNTNSTNQDTMIIDFGDGNPICISNFKQKSGKIEIIYTGKYRDSLSIITATLNNYNVNYNLIQGEIIITNQGRNNNNNIEFSIIINNARINTLSGTIDWQANQIKEWVNGINTSFNIFDDSYIITNYTANGNGLNGKSFTMQIKTPLTMNIGCLNYLSCIIKSGEVRISPNDYNDRVISYGDSICDCNFDVLIDGESYPLVVN